MSRESVEGRRERKKKYKIGGEFRGEEGNWVREIKKGEEVANERKSKRG